jgi:hypothetical protein
LTEPRLATHEFSIPTVWRLEARAEDVYAILNDPAEFVRWWPEVYLRVEVLREADVDGGGRVEGLQREVAHRATLPQKP